MERLIGKGGMGEVWQARHLELDAAVAVKLAVPGGDDPARFRERFRREARALAQHRSADLVQLYDVGEHDGLPFLVMELLQGESLKARFARATKLPAAELLKVVRCIGRALTVIHGAGLVHRDVTPANIFLLDSKSGAPAKLLDLGIVKPMATESQTTTTGTVIGSPAYMSPEQARAEAVDARSDLWSLAAVVFRAISGRDVFEGRSVTDVLVSVCTAEIPAITGTDADRALDAFFERAFARNPARRFASATAFVAALEHALAPARSEPSKRQPRALGAAALLGASIGALLCFVATRASAPAVAAPRPAECPAPLALPTSNDVALPPATPPLTSGDPAKPTRTASAKHAAPPASSSTTMPNTDPLFGLPVTAPRP